jgi:predicted RNA-binding Zn ribbon-like protein
METTPVVSGQPRELPIVGGHLALDFANTVDDPLGPARHDHVGTYPDLIRWSSRVELLQHDQVDRLLSAAAQAPRAEQTALHRAHQLRLVLNDLFGAVADGRSDVTGHWQRLRPFVTSAVAAADLASAGEADHDPGGADRRLRWTWPQGEELDAVLHPIAMAAAELLVGPDLPRIKRCARCPWLFVDKSRNHSRRWCDMDDCGKAEKIERYVARRAARRRSGH